MALVEGIQNEAAEKKEEDPEERELGSGGRHDQEIQGFGGGPLGRLGQPGGTENGDENPPPKHINPTY
eukprot:5634787-Amphidinium_carterae.1